LQIISVKYQEIVKKHMLKAAHEKGTDKKMKREEITKKGRINF
jgi:hypothetical protein